jgi:hypothetical protein
MNETVLLRAFTASQAFTRTEIIKRKTIYSQYILSFQQQYIHKNTSDSQFKALALTILSLITHG